MGASRYHVIGTLGSGGMAEVELAVQSGAGNVRRLAAVKRVRPEHSRSSDFEKMFLEEARISAALGHPNVVHTYEVGRDEAGCFMVMEFLSGQSYAKVLDEVGFDSVDYGFALEVLIATLDGLDYAHNLKDVTGKPMAIVHRDISPANLFVGYDGQIKILDFGIAKALGSSVQTKSGVIKGKVAYMAPEQVRAEAIDARADLYAVGVMLWEVTRGESRWGDLPDVAIMLELGSNKPPESARAAERGLPALADAICARALAPEPQARYRSAAEFRADLLKLSAEVGSRRSARDIGGYVSLLFSVEQRRLQQEIDAALSELEEPGQSRPARTRIVARETTDETPGVVSDRSRALERRLPLLLALLAAGSAAGLAIALWPRADAPQPNAEAAPSTATSPASAVAVVASAPPTASVPAAASVTTTPRPLRRAAPRAKSSAPQPPPASLSLDRSDPWSK